MSQRRTAARRPPALGARIVVGAATVAVTAAAMGWMERSARAEEAPEAPSPVTVRRIVVVEEKDPYVTLEIVPSGRRVVVVTPPPIVVHRAPAPAAPVAVATTSSGS